MEYHAKIMKYLSDNKSGENILGMSRFGINVEKAFGVRNADLKKLASDLKREIKDKHQRHKLSKSLWSDGYHETMTLTAYLDVPELITEEEMDGRVYGFNSWAVCDTVTGHLLDKVPFVYKKIEQYTKDKREFVKRAGFALIAWRAVHDKERADDVFIKLLDVIKREANDDRNFVKKSVNWALRQIGKRNNNLKKASVRAAKEILKSNSKSAQWIAKDALRELNGG